MSQIERTGHVTFSDTSLNVYEEGIPREFRAAKAWELLFKRQVFARIVQQLNRLGWTCELPQYEQREKDLYPSIYEESRRQKRQCHKGDLHGFLNLSGRTIQFEMWQDVANVSNPNGGRYDFDKYDRMPYTLRLEMERTRRRIREYLCGVFTGYEFKSDLSDGRSNKCGSMHLTAMEWLNGCYATSSHFKGDLTKYTISDYNRKSANKTILEHGQRVWFYDQKGRINTGIAYYNINNMWWVVTGKYAVTNVSSFELFTECPENYRIKRNESQRRNRLEGELAKAIKAMNFEHAAVLRDILFPKREPLFMVWHNDHKAYHRAGFCGYTNNVTDAGKFTADEVNGWDRDPNKVVAMESAA